MDPQLSLGIQGACFLKRFLGTDRSLQLASQGASGPQGPPGPREPSQNVGLIGGIRSHPVSSKTIGIGPIFVSPLLVCGMPLRGARSPWEGSVSNFGRGSFFQSKVSPMKSGGIECPR